MRRPALPALVLAVVAMHAAVLWLLVIATRPHEGNSAHPARRIVMALVQITPRVKVEPPAPPKEAVVRAPMAPSPPTGAARTPKPLRGNAPPATDAPTADPGAPQSASPAPPPPLILHSESARRALRDIGREHSFADQVNQDLSGNPRSAFDSPLSAGVSGAARGDCRKGEFKGGGMGLLSLPALALAAASGECAR